MEEPASLPQAGQPPGPSTTSDKDRSETCPKGSTRAGGDAGGVADKGCGLSAVEKKLVSEWVPLGLSFGVPLFDEGANKVVCDKVRGLYS